MRAWSKRGAYPTLGFAVLDWIAEHLPSPANRDEPFIPTDDQGRFILEWYRVDPLTGLFVNSRAALEEAKGYGKSPIAAAIALAEFASDRVLFDGWDEQGEPTTRAWSYPWVQIAAVSEDQTDNTYRALYEMLIANDNKAAKALGIDQGKTRLELKGRPGHLEPVTASAVSREGQRITFAILDETHLWTQRNGGTKLAGTLRRNVTKMSGRTIETTNAPLLGEKSVAERTGSDAEAGGKGILHVAHRPSIEPLADWTDAQMAGAITEVYGAAPWIDQRRILAEIRDPATGWDDALRYYFNVRTRGAGRAVDPRLWSALIRVQEVPDGTSIGIGFDGAHNRDGTVLRGCTRDGYRFTIGKWLRPVGQQYLIWQNDHPGQDWVAPRQDVRDALDRAFATWSVGLMLCDPWKWQTEIAAWAEAYGDKVVLEFNTNTPTRMAPALDRWLVSIREGAGSHDGDPTIAEHVANARLKRVRLEDDPDDAHTRYILEKAEPGLLIDGAVADVLAYEAAMTMPDSAPSVYETRGVLVLGR